MVFYVEYYVICRQSEFYFFSNLDSFISFSSLIAIAKTSKTLLNIRGESRHPYLVPDFRGNAFNLFPLRIMFAVGLSYMAFIMLMFVPSMPAFWRVFIINGYWILSKTFSAFMEIIIWFLSFNLLIYSSILTWRIPWTEEPGRPQSIGLQRVRHYWSHLACMHLML